jgi:hypothetical protein
VYHGLQRTSCPVVWLKRPVDDILCDLERDHGSRPAYYPGGRTFSDVYGSRMPHFEDCSDYQFNVLRGDRDYDAISGDFVALLSRIGVVSHPWETSPRFDVNTPSSAFLCLTLPAYCADDVKDTISTVGCESVGQYLRKVCVGVDCVEIRLDMLRDCSRGE